LFSASLLLRLRHGDGDNGAGGCRLRVRGYSILLFLTSIFLKKTDQLSSVRGRFDTIYIYIYIYIYRKGGCMKLLHGFFKIISLRRSWWHVELGLKCMSMGQRKGTSFHSRIEVKASTMISILICTKISILILGFLYRNKLTPAGQPPWNSASIYIYIYI
jgi:hypothetical protein